MGTSEARPHIFAWCRFILSFLPNNLLHFGQTASSFLIFFAAAISDGEPNSVDVDLSAAQRLGTSLMGKAHRIRAVHDPFECFLKKRTQFIVGDDDKLEIRSSDEEGILTLSHTAS